MDKDTLKVSPVKTFIRRVISVFKVTTLVLIGYAIHYYTSNLWHASESQCYIEGAVVVACQRDETEDAYVWNVVAIKDEGTVSQEVILIKHKVPKNKVGYFYAF